jgi:hypothetical protein
MLYKKLMLMVIVSIILGSCAIINSKSPKKIGATSRVQTFAIGRDSLINKADTTKKNIPKPYNQIISKNAIADDGLFTIHIQQDRYLIEIPDSLLGRELLIVNRISKAPTGARLYNGLVGYAGDQIGEKVVRFERGPNFKLFLKDMSFSEKAQDSSGNGMYLAVLNSNLQPIVASFDIKAFGKDSSCVIDVSDYISGDNPMLFFERKTAFQVGSLQKDRSYIASIKSFPINVELVTVKTFSGGGNSGEGSDKTFELNSSIVLLPKIPMKTRKADARVGYFTAGYLDFDANPQSVANSFVIRRWRLEPKEEDVMSYLRGDLVEPQKPIIYYIDPATPKKWVPYLVQGVNDWKKTFERAGFKNAIYALEVPANNQEFSLFDGRHNAIVYKPSVVPNASGPHVHDPRSGEILETHINWYHNVMTLIHNWYMVQAGAIDPRARKMEFNDSLMGQLIRFVACHEVGHTLGLTHNFGSSSTVPVDSLRNKHYVETYGHTPSIMDYARFNYVAQPEDRISEKGIFPRIGMYDEWAIEWGYRWFPESKFSSEKVEKAFFSQWVTNTLQKNKQNWYGEQPPTVSVFDPRNQSEDLGDDAMKAGFYGIKNLKRIFPQLIEWTKEPNEDYSNLRMMSKEVINQYERYVGHVVNNIGLYTWTYKSVEEKGDIVGFIPKEKQKAAVQFLHAELFDTPYWLMNKEIFGKVGGSGPWLPMSAQYKVLNKLVSFSTYNRLVYFEAQQLDRAYNFDDLMTDLEAGIWKELVANKPIDFYRRNLQNLYVERLDQVMNPFSSLDPIERADGYNFQRSDMYSIVQNHIKGLIFTIDKALSGSKDRNSRDHLVIAKQRLKKILTEKKVKAGELPSDKNSSSGINLDLVTPYQPRIFDYHSCWEKLSEF